MLRIARGEYSPDAFELLFGDIAPLEQAPQSPPEINAADLVLLRRALADTDGDGEDDAADASPLTGVRYRHADHLRSAVVVTGADGSELERVTYRPYGSTVSGAAAPAFGFTGERFEKSVGIYDYGARWYDPELGRFLQPDSVVPDPGTPQTLNRYAYTRNNPLGRTDPSGNTSIDVNFGGTSGFDPFAAADRFGEELILGGASDPFAGGFQSFEVGSFLSSPDAFSGISGPRRGGSRGGFGAADAALLGGSLLGGFIPGVGETLDFGTLVAPGSTLTDRVIAGASLGINVFTAGVLPNFGAVSRAGSEVGGALPVRVGQRGEELAGTTGPKTRIPSATGTAEFRLPDELTPTMLREVKNVQRLRTGGRSGNQLIDFATEARRTGRQCVLCVRQNTEISPRSQEFLDDLGISVERELP